ncbi:U-box domain-containing protein 4 [Hordeum vulgare]|nr:U-box domain-containing protein 4 [Hordeum vulgare]
MDRYDMQSSGYERVPSAAAKPSSKHKYCIKLILYVRYLVEFSLLRIEFCRLSITSSTLSTRGCVESLLLDNEILDKEVVPPLEKGKEVVPPLFEEPVQDHPSPKWRNYGHYHQESGPSHFYKVILAPKLKSLPLLLDFTKHFPAIPAEFKLKTNTGYAWRVTVRYTLTFKLLTPDTMKVIVFDDEGVEVVTKCKEHDNAFAATA